MKPDHYSEVFCPFCGWGLCLFPGGKLYERIYTQKQGYPFCPYCKIRGTGYLCIPNENNLRQRTIREPVNLRPHIPEHIRERMLEKYNHACAICGSTTHLHIDHIVSALDSNGIIDINNLQVLCRTCNSSKGARSTISKQRRIALDIREKLYAHASQPGDLSLAEISRITGVKYATVLKYQHDIRKWMK